MSVETLKEYFGKWLRLSTQQREFVLALLTSQEFPIVNVVALIDQWESEIIEHGPEGPEEEPEEPI